MSLLGDYLDSLSPEEVNAFHEGPNSTIAARGRPFTDIGADLVYRPTSSPTSSSTPRMTYAGPAMTASLVAPVTTAPVAAGEWRRAVSLQALALASAVASVLMRYPSSPVTTALFVTPLRTFGLRVLDPSAITVENARATINGLASLLRGASFVSAGGAAELRAGLDRIVAMIPTASSSGGAWTPTPSIPGGGGGIGPSSPGPSTTTPAGGGGGSAPAPSTSGCPTNASPVAGGCACDPGFAPDVSMTACVPIASGPAPSPGPRPASSYGSGSGMGWLLLLGGAALAYKALR